MFEQGVPHEISENVRALDRKIAEPCKICSLVKTLFLGDGESEGAARDS